MIKKFKESLRSWARGNLLTFNTIRYRVEFPRIREAFEKIGRQHRVFDGGAGGGQMLRQVFESGFCEKGTGYEFDPKLHELLVSNFASVPNLTAELGSLLKIEHPDGSFDCAMTTQVLEHIEDHATAAAELSRIVKPGGYLIVSVPHPPEPFPTEGHVREGYTEEDLVKLFSSPHHELLQTGYSMIRPTIDRAMFANRFPMRGMYFPVAWADRETHLSDEERQAMAPYGITCLFRKSESIESQEKGR